MLTFNEDQTVTVDLLPKDGKPRSVTLRQPGMLELAELEELGGKADECLPPLPVPDTDPPSREHLIELQEVINERHRRIYGPELVYGKFMLAIVHMLGDPTIEANDLPSGAANGATPKKIMSHFKDPLAGRESTEPATEPSN